MSQYIWHYSVLADPSLPSWARPFYLWCSAVVKWYVPDRLILDEPVYQGRGALYYLDWHLQPISVTKVDFNRHLWGMWRGRQHGHKAWRAAFNPRALCLIYMVQGVKKSLVLLPDNSALKIAVFSFCWGLVLWLLFFVKAHPHMHTLAKSISFVLKCRWRTCEQGFTDL